MAKPTKVWVTLESGRRVECQRSEGGMYREIAGPPLSETYPVGTVLRHQRASGVYVVKTASGWMFIDGDIAEAATVGTVEAINDCVLYEEVTL